MTFSLHDRHFPDVLSHNEASTDPSTSHVPLHAILEKASVTAYVLYELLFGLWYIYIIYYFDHNRKEQILEKKFDQG